MSNYDTELDGDNGVDDDIRLFFSKRGIDDEELDAVDPVIQSALEETLEKIESHSPSEVHTEDTGSVRIAAEQEAADEQTEKFKDDAIVKGNPRDYQVKLFEIAKAQNTIVHLGTGMGKTFVAILLIKEYASRQETQTQQAVFLVPSVALAVQQTETLVANLALDVKTASQYTVISAGSRQKLAECQVLVATHGAYLELLKHYGDMFSIDKVHLMIIDECHHCTGNSAYVSILRNFYHRTALERRPRILGLTASPLINFKTSVSPTQLNTLLRDLETTLDSKIVSMKALGIQETEASAYLNRNLSETILTYTAEDAARKLPEYDAERVHFCRKKELDQLTQLFIDLGPLVVRLYCQFALEEIKRNEYEAESHEEFLVVKEHLQSIITWCEGKGGGRSEKLIELERLLSREFGKDSSAVGLLFVQRRITAAALNVYFRSKSRYEHHRECLRNDVVPAVGHKNQPLPSRDDKFMDAEEDFGVQIMSDHEVDYDEQFADASDDEELDLHVIGPFKSYKQKGNDDVDDGATAPFRVRPTVLMRQQTSRKMYGRSMSNELADEMWSSDREDIADALRGLRCNEFNLLIATAVVEEGIDIQTCNFVIIFDALNSLKSYVQMKGRARQRNAALFVFENSSSHGSLETVQSAERRLCEFLVEREYAMSDDMEDNKRENTKLEGEWGELLEPGEIELQALQEGRYCTDTATLSLRDAKSLLYQFAVGQALDVAARASRTAFQVYLPFYHDTENILVMPAHMSASRGLRQVRLPDAYSSCNKRERERVLCFLACIRLHSIGLLNERLQPLSKDDIKQRVLEAAGKHPLRKHIRSVSVSVNPQHDGGEWFVTPVLQSGTSLYECSKVLDSDDTALGILSRVPLPDVQPLNLCHADFGDVEIKQGKVFRACLSDADLELAKEFFEVAFNARWRRRTRKSRFYAKEASDDLFGMMAYCVVLVDEVKGVVAWEKMKNIAAEASRDELQRREAVRGTTELGRLAKPRLWSPIYDPMAVYIAYNSSGRCSDSFPDESYDTFTQFFKEKKGITVDPEEELFTCQKLWHLPNRGDVSGEQTRKRRLESGHCAAQDDIAGPYCTVLYSVKLPPACCVETPISDAGVYLLLLYLPQYLHHMEAFLTRSALLQQCRVVLPDTATVLEEIPPNQLIASFSTKSYHAVQSYDRLEWLGDSVLKLVLSDSLLQSPELGSWIQLLNEGYLSTARDSLASNANLADVCKKLGFDNFILSRSLSRGEWTPGPLNLIGEDGVLVEHKPPSVKVRADVLEALMGLVYSYSGIDAARTLLVEMGLVCPSDGSWEFRKSQEKVVVAKAKLDAAMNFTGQHTFRNRSLVEEAFCHPTALGSRTPSYQILEWLGDAVLCLAAREWVFKAFPNRSVGDMVRTEALLNSNEALAFLSSRKGIYKYMDHRDQSLQSRLDQYTAELASRHGVLWGTSPPKSLADVVESLLGLVHVDRGFGAGQCSAQHILSPILQLISSLTEDQILVHPLSRLKQLTGSLLAIETYDSDSFAKKFINAEVWNGFTWGPPGKNKIVSRIHCYGRTLINVQCPSKSAAVNLACSLVVSVVARQSHTPEFIERLRHARSLAQKHVTASSMYQDIISSVDGS